MTKKNSACSCGGEFDENGICLACGKKRPRSGGYRVLHGFLCVLASLIVLGCMSSALSMQHYLTYHNISGGLENSRLSDFKIPFSGGQTVTEYIRREYVTDENVLPEDISSALDEMDITGYLADKATAMGAMLRGETDEYPTLTTDEIIGLLENSEETLYSKCMLVIEDSDKEAIRGELDGRLAKLTDIEGVLYGSKAGRALARFRVSKARVIVDFVLLGLLLWRWIVVRKRSGKPGYGAVRGMGFVFLIPSALTLIAAIVTGLQMAFKSDEVASLYTLVKGIRQPHWLNAPLGAAFGILLISLAGYIRGKVLYPKKKPAKQETAAQNIAAPAPRRAEQESPAPRRIDRTEEKAPAPRPEKDTKPAEGKACVGCGRDIPQNAMFCIFCGAKQAAEQSAEKREQKIDEILGSAAENPSAAAQADNPADAGQGGIPDSPMKTGMQSYLKRIEAESDDSQS